LQEPPEFVLPLLADRLWNEDEDAASAPQRHEFRGESELNRLAQPNLVGQDEPGAAASVILEGESDEILLMRPEAVVAPIDRQLHDRGCGVSTLALTPGLEVGNDRARGEPSHILDDRIGELDGLGSRPQRVELLLNPGDRFSAVIGPDELIIERQSRFRLVWRCPERQASSRPRG
jgi:hypothetical protein